MTSHTTLHINCQGADKSAWVLSARVSGMAFEDWVTQQLNAAAINPNPEWLSGLSERARLCLLSAGFSSRESVQQAIADGFDIAALNNAGNRVKTEVDQWIK